MGILTNKDVEEVCNRLNKALNDLRKIKYAEPLLLACAGLLSEKPGGEDRPFSQIPEITGCNLYVSCIPNIISLVRLANNLYDPTSSETKLYPGVAIHKPPKSSYSQKNSELGAIFENLRAFELARQNQTGEYYSQADCLTAWDIFCEFPPEIAKTVIADVLAELYIFSLEQVKNLIAQFKVSVKDINRLAVEVDLGKCNLTPGNIPIVKDSSFDTALVDIKPCSLENLLSALGMTPDDILKE